MLCDLTRSKGELTHSDPEETKINQFGSPLLSQNRAKVPISLTVEGLLSKQVVHIDRFPLFRMGLKVIFHPDKSILTFYNKKLGSRNIFREHPTSFCFKVCLSTNSCIFLRSPNMLITSKQEKVQCDNTTCYQKDISEDMR